MIRAVIDQNEFPLFRALIASTDSTASQELLGNWSVEHRHEDADKRLRGKFTPPRTLIVQVARSRAGINWNHFWYSLDAMACGFWLSVKLFPNCLSQFAEGDTAREIS